MKFDECTRYVGGAVRYTPRSGESGSVGRIVAVKQLVMVEFHDGTKLQVNPHCLEPIVTVDDSQPTLFGNTHDE